MLKHIPTGRYWHPVRIVKIDVVRENGTSKKMTFKGNLGNEGKIYRKRPSIKGFAGENYRSPWHGGKLVPVVDSEWLVERFELVRTAT